MTAIVIGVIILSMAIGILTSWFKIARVGAGQSRAQKFLLCRPAFLAAGAGLMLIGFVLILDAQLFRRTAVKTQGTLIEVIERKDGDGTSYYPIFAFSVGAKNVTRQSSFSIDPKEVQTGKTVTVYYHPENPEKARIEEDFRSARLIGTVQGITGMTTLIIGFLLPGLIQRFTRRRKSGNNADPNHM